MAHWQSLSAYLTTIAIILLALAWVESASAQSAFYRSKTITIRYFIPIPSASEQSFPAIQFVAISL